MGDLQDPKMEVRKRTICLAIFCGDIPWNLGLIYGIGTSNQSDPESWPLKYRTWGIFMGTEMMKHWRYHVDIKWYKMGFHGVSEWAYIDYNGDTMRKPKRSQRSHILMLCVREPSPNVSRLRDFTQIFWCGCLLVLEWIWHKKKTLVMGCLLGYVLIQKFDTPRPVHFRGMLGATASQNILFHGTICDGPCNVCWFVKLHS